MGLESLGLTIDQVIDIVSMYSCSDGAITAVATEPGWKIIGAFPMPATANIRIDVIGCVSDPSLTMTIRLYCITDGFVAEASGSRATLSGTVDSEVFSGVFSLPGNRVYQFQVQVVGGAGEAFFGSVRRAAPVGRS